MAIKKPSYIILFDTNILIYGNPIKSNVLAFVEKYSNSDQMEIEFYLPEVVWEEYKRNYLKIVNEAKSKYTSSSSDLHSYAGFSPKKIQFTDAEILSRAEKLLKNNGIKKLKTPIKQINLKKIIHDAVYYNDPFNEATNEKGFKDSIIAETIRLLIDNTNDEVYVVFVCNDKLLREFITKWTEKHPYFKVFESIPAFETDLKLHLLKISKAHIETLKDQAKYIFSNQMDGLFYKERVREQLSTKFQTQYINPDRNYGNVLLSSLNAWTPTTDSTYEISNPIFINKNGNEFRWETIVVNKRKYIENESTSRSLLLSAIPSYPRMAYFHFEFKVEWTTEITDDDKVINPKITDLSLIKISRWDIFNPPPSLVDYKTPPSSGATITSSGVGTTLLSEIDIDKK